VPGKTLYKLSSFSGRVDLCSRLCSFWPELGAISHAVCPWFRSSENELVRRHIVAAIFGHVLARLEVAGRHRAARAAVACGGYGGSMSRFESVEMDGRLRAEILPTGPGVVLLLNVPPGRLLERLSDRPRLLS
jgi:hypothetical protein